MEIMARLAAGVLLARPLKAANPDALHPGKAKKTPGEARFPLGFLWLSMGQKLSNYRIFQQQAETIFSAQLVTSPIGLQGMKSLAAGSGAAEAPAFPYRIRVILRNTLTRVLATVDMVLMKISRATPTTSLRVSPTVSPVTAALWAAEPLP